MCKLLCWNPAAFQKQCKNLLRLNACKISSPSFQANSSPIPEGEKIYTTWVHSASYWNKEILFSSQPKLAPAESIKWVKMWSSLCSNNNQVLHVLSQCCWFCLLTTALMLHPSVFLLFFFPAFAIWQRWVKASWGKRHSPVEELENSPQALSALGKGQLATPL